jgi:hypothetical protein
MMLQEVVNIIPTKVREGDLVLVEVADGLSEERRFFIEATLSDCAEDVGAHFMVFPENIVRDLRALTLEEMVNMRNLLEEFIGTISDRDSVGDA